MRYYVREDYEAQVKGPFSVDELKEKLQSGEMSSEYFASGDYGEGLEQLQIWRSRDWFRLAEIGDLQDVLPVPEDINYNPKPKEESWLSILGGFVGTLALFGLAARDDGWLLWVFSFFSVDDIYSTMYIQRIEKFNNVVSVNDQAFLHYSSVMLSVLLDVKIFLKSGRHF